jgi:heterotetrameric sarcosine oxidase delta subunit
MRIVCPICGERGLAEFAYGGDATVRRPSLDAPVEAWQAAVYDRENPRAIHAEFWHHALGCRAWLRVERDTATHRITSVTLSGRWAGESDR